MMKKDMKKVPAVRFKGFTDDWEQRKFRDLLQLRRGLTYSPADVRQSGIRVLRSSNINGNTFTINDDDVFVDAASVNIPLVNNGDILITAANGSSKLVGKHAIIKNITDSMAVHGGFMLLGSGTDTKFVNALLGSLWYQRFIRTHVAGGNGAIGNLNKSELESQKVLVPSEEEQHQIGTFFSEIDDTITLHQRKSDQLKKLKAYFLQNLFPAKGEKVPKIRFKGFTGEWEQRKLGDFGSVAMCKRIFKNQTTENGDIPFYKIGTFGGKPDAYISKNLFDEYKKKYPYPEKGDILISASGSIGRTVEYTGEDAYYQDSNIVWLKHDNRIQNSFLIQLYKIVKWAGIEGSTIKRLYNDNILKTKILIPSVQEQIIIGNYFNNIDNLITLHQQKITQLQAVKKFLLQNLFV
ncbi:restriction endonuclease subunit S [Acidaminococcus massiliensis]|jgi:type I restriction enzyme S subunit|uniref:restriction endonuclease subunit S n=2 Tax=Acidaminococcus massiliensis TaxID=1852375 RepID=UPI001177C01D|nr:restriction endonuclease subunit S [Acidaminococcus massiliensis]